MEYVKSEAAYLYTYTVSWRKGGATDCDRGGRRGVGGDVDSQCGTLRTASDGCEAR